MKDSPHAPVDAFAVLSDDLPAKLTKVNFDHLFVMTYHTRIA